MQSASAAHVPGARVVVVVVVVVVGPAVVVVVGATVVVVVVVGAGVVGGASVVVLVVVVVDLGSTHPRTGSNTNLPGHWHSPLRQSVPDGQTLPQVPQLFGSRFRS